MRASESAYSTAFETPSPVRKKHKCKCGSTKFCNFKSKMNCKQCGVIVIK